MSAVALLGLEEMAAVLSSLRFHARTYPDWCQDRIHVIHDGIDTALLRPAATASLGLLGLPQIQLSAKDPVLTFVNRNLEPYRGYHRLMRALPAIQRRCPDLLTVIVGGDGVSYGAALPTGWTWRQIYLDVASDLDLMRVSLAIHLLMFTGACCRSALPRFFTYPFVLRWSCLESLSTGCVVVGSDMAPVRKVIEHGENGLLVDFFNHQPLIATVVDVIYYPSSYAQQRDCPRTSVVQGYDYQIDYLPAQPSLVGRSPDSLRPAR